MPFFALDRWESKKDIWMNVEHLKLSTCLTCWSGCCAKYFSQHCYFSPHHVTHFSLPSRRNQSIRWFGGFRMSSSSEISFRRGMWLVEIAFYAIKFFWHFVFLQLDMVCRLFFYKVLSGNSLLWERS